MKQKWLKKGSSVLLAVAMVLSLFPGGVKGTLATVQAAENTEPASEYWTDVAGLKSFSLGNEADTVGKVIFGQNGSGSAQVWKIAGTDSRIVGDNIILYADTSFGKSVYESSTEDRVFDYGGEQKEVYGEHYGSCELRSALQDYSSNTAYFSSSEQGKMNDTTIYTYDQKNNINYTTTDKLYLPYGVLLDNFVTVGTNSSDNLNDGIRIDCLKLGPEWFWLRSPGGDRSSVLVCYEGDIVVPCAIEMEDTIDVMPAFNLNLSSDTFASAADAASSSYIGYKANSDMTENTYILRYPSVGAESAVISRNADSVTVTKASGKYLMVQNHVGVFAMAIDSDKMTINAGDIVMDGGLTDFNHCKVWIESTDEDRITTAKMATQPTIIDSVDVTDITAPAAGTALDMTAACAVTGVTDTVPAVTWTPNDTTAGYDVSYTASVTLTAADNYEFASSVTATVNGQNATSVVKNDDGTVTVTYAFPATDKEKLISVTAPAGITVANGTSYTSMGLPDNVEIVTETNTETKAAVVWDTTTPVSGSYDPTVLTEQVVTLNGTVTCPSNIDQNNVALTTTITVTISAAEIVGTPTFSPEEGTYTENQSVTLSSSTDGAVIYYTTDGTTPTTGSHVYNGAISVTGTEGESISTTIKAIAVKSGMQNSSVASATYVIEIPVSAPSTYAVIVNNGTGDGNYVAGATVTITADAAPDGQVFDRWTVVSGGVTLASEASVTTTFEMPAKAVEVTATYKNKPSDSSKKDEAPKTGDSTPIARLIIMAVVGGTGVVYFGRKKKTVI